MFGISVPANGRSLVYATPPSREKLWKAWASVITEDAGSSQYNSQPQPQATTAESTGVRVVWCDIRRWIDYSGIRPEREEAAARCLLARNSWAPTIAKLMVPVAAWEQEHWGIRLVPSEEEEKRKARTRSKADRKCFVKYDRRSESGPLDQ
jgi:hypothetical protein